MNAEFDNEIMSFLNEITAELREEIYEFKTRPFENGKNWIMNKGRTCEKHSSLERLERLKFMLKHRRNPKVNERWMLKY